MNTTENVIKQGAMYVSLKRDNKQIRDDRAEGIIEDAEMTYSRKLQDIDREIKGLERKRNNMLDLSPTNADSLMLGEDFNATKMVDKDLEIGIKIRELEIKKEILTSRYNFLFKAEVKNG